VTHEQQPNAATIALRSRVIAAFRRGSLLGCLAIALLPAPLSAQGGDGSAYRLAPGDRVTVTVFGQPDLSGDVVVDGAGTITVPLINSVEVKDLTLAECQRRIGDLLADGILQKPSVSVRIAELRPLYVLGDVRLPGAYPFRFGNTVQGAVALAGGFGPGETVRNTAISEYLAAEERVRQLTLQQRTLLVRKARLEAQRDGQDSFSPPASTEATSDKATAEIVANETDIFSTQRNILRDQVEALRSQQPLLQEQIDADTEQSSAGKKQLALIREQIERYQTIFRQGLGTQNNEVQYRVLEANQEAAVWRLLSDVARLHVQSRDFDSRIQEVEAVFRRQIALQLQETRDQLKALEVTLPAAIEMRNVKLQYAGGAAAPDAKHLITIARTRNGNTVVLDADETTPVEPGDVIDVKNDLSRVLPHDEAAADLPASRPLKPDQTQAETAGTSSR